MWFMYPVISLTQKICIAVTQACSLSSGPDSIHLPPHAPMSNGVYSSDIDCEGDVCARGISLPTRQLIVSLSQLGCGVIYYADHEGTNRSLIPCARALSSIATNGISNTFCNEEPGPR
jgi:hypothetical protein